MEYYGIHYDSVIEHHGIKGQKWGVRRYQNSDGTLTELGKKKLRTQHKRLISKDYKAQKASMKANAEEAKAAGTRSERRYQARKEKADSLSRTARSRQYKAAKYYKKMEKRYGTMALKDLTDNNGASFVERYSSFFIYR